MTFKDKLELIQTKMFELISTKEITLLKELDNRIKINKFGKYNYKNLHLHYSNIWRFLNDLESNKIYVIIPLLSRNSRPDQPYILLPSEDNIEIGNQEMEPFSIIKE